MPFSLCSFLLVPFPSLSAASAPQNVPFDEYHWTQRKKRMNASGREFTGGWPLRRFVAITNGKCCCTCHFSSKQIGALSPKYTNRKALRSFMTSVQIDSCWWCWAIDQQPPLQYPYLGDNLPSRSEESSFHFIDKTFLQCPDWHFNGNLLLI